MAEENSNKVARNLTYTKNEYIDIIRMVSKELRQKDRPNEKQYSEMYGIYYNALAGLIRSGSMCRKEMDTDGYGKIFVMAGDKEVSCKDIAVRDILREEYEEVVHPYDDSSESYVHPYLPDRKKVKRVVQNEKGEKVVTVEEVREVDFAEPGKKGGVSVNLDIGKAAESMAEAKRLKAEAAFKRAEGKEYLKELGALDYDPDYDHYYSEELPKVLEEISTVRRDSLIKGFCTVMAFGGVILSLLFLC